METNYQCFDYIQFPKLFVLFPRLVFICGKYLYLAIMDLVQGEIDYT